MNQTLTQIQEEELEHWKDKNLFILGDDETIPMLENSFNKVSLRVLEKVKEILKKHRGIYGMGNIDDVYLELSTIIEQK